MKKETFTNKLKIIIENFKPVICINGKIYKSLNFYIENSDYTNNMLHCYYHNKEKNVINISFISEYAMKKITGEV